MIGNILPQPRIAIVGPGAVGGSLGADMVRAGLDVTLIDPWPAHVDVMRQHGLTVHTPTGTEVTPVQAFHVSEVAELRSSFDVVFVSVKTYDTRWIVQLVKPLLHARSVVVGLQNGMTIDHVADLVGRERTLGAVLGIAANMFVPGVIERQISREGTWFTVGTLDGLTIPELDLAADALGHAGTLERSTDIRSSKWMKLIANIPEMLPSAILNAPLLQAVEVDGIRPVMDEASREAYRVALASGATMLPIFGKRADEVPEGDEYALQLLDAVLESYSLPDTRVAVLQDWQKGRRAELDAFSGYIVEQGAALAVDTPVNRAVLEIALRIERGDLRPSLDNADLLRSSITRAA